MVRRCYVPECSSEEGKEDHRGVTYHKIPIHSDIRPKWMSLCHISEEKKDMKAIYVCSRHFLSADFCLFKGKRYMLKQGVLPSVFPWKKAVAKRRARSNVSSSTASKKTSQKNASGDAKHKAAESEVTNKKQLAISATATSTAAATAASSSSAGTSSSNKTIVAEATSTSCANESSKTDEKIKAFVPNMRIEALDFNEKWIPAQIVEVDYEENEVLIHFEKYSNKYDEWISMNSSRLRPLQSSKSEETFSVGEKCMAFWNESEKYPATVTKILNNDMYEVTFDDGYVKALKTSRLIKIDDKQSLVPEIFESNKNTKRERRDRKRKSTAFAFFGKKKSTRKSLIEEDFSSSWMPLFENGVPVGRESTIELSDGVRKSIIISDPRLPANWDKHLVKRTHGPYSGKWDAIIVSPEGKRFRTRNEIKTFLDSHPDLDFSENTFDFSIYRRSRKTGARPVEKEKEVSRASVSFGDQSETVKEDVETDDSDTSEIGKIAYENGVFKCPEKTCTKTFRRENLVQMHVKHYHPEYTKFMDSTPNVADLAYARTVGDNNLYYYSSPSASSRYHHTSKTAQSKSSSTVVNVQSKKVEKIEAKLPTPTVSEEEKDDAIMKDSEILKLLNTKPTVGSVNIKYPPGLPSKAYPDIKLKDLLVPELTPFAKGIKTLLPVVKTEVKEEVEDGQYVHDQQEQQQQQEQEKEEQQLQQQQQRKQADNFIVEGGEVIKIVQMKREEIINCTCGITEEDGLMIQCELCLCWQHAHCNNIEKENQVPDKYICYICQNPPKQRSSRTYYHDQDWLKQGTLPVGSYHCKDEEMLQKRFDKLKKSHEYSGQLIELNSFIHALRVKLNIADAKNHPKLYLWSKPWVKQETQTGESIKKEVEKDDEKATILDDKIVTKDKDEEVAPSNKDSFESVVKTENKELLNNDDFERKIPVVKIPQPEAAIDSSECRVNLLEHVKNAQKLAEDRLNLLEERINCLEGIIDDEGDNHEHICRTVKILMQDLTTLQEFGRCSGPDKVI